MVNLQEKLRDCYCQELLFYRNFHQHPLNIAIHTICVPIEWFGFVLLLNFVHLHNAVSWGTALYYLVLQTRVKYIAATGHILFGFASQYLFVSLGNWMLVMATALVMELVAWFAQIVVGHKFIEKNSPGMQTQLTLNSIVLSVLLAWDVGLPFLFNIGSVRKIV